MQAPKRFRERIVPTALTYLIDTKRRRLRRQHVADALRLPVTSQAILYARLTIG